MAHDAIDADGVQQADPMMVDMSSSLGVMGVLHILHNGVKELHAAMSDWPKYASDLKLISDLCRRQWSKDRLIETCFSDPTVAKYYSARYITVLEKFTASVYTGRWGTIAEATEAVGQLEHCLRFGWDLSKFCKGKVTIENMLTDKNIFTDK